MHYSRFFTLYLWLWYTISLITNLYELHRQDLFEIQVNPCVRAELRTVARTVSTTVATNDQRFAFILYLLYYIKTAALSILSQQLGTSIVSGGCRTYLDWWRDILRTSELFAAVDPANVSSRYVFDIWLAVPCSAIMNTKNESAMNTNVKIILTA